VLKEFIVCHKHVSDLCDSIDAVHCKRSGLPDPFAAPVRGEIDCYQFRANGGVGVPAGSEVAVQRITVPGGLEVAQQLLTRVIDLLAQLIQEAKSAKGVSIDLYQRKNKLIPKLQQTRLLLAYLLDKYGKLRKIDLHRILTERPSNVSRQRRQSSSSASDKGSRKARKKGRDSSPSVSSHDTPVFDVADSGSEGIPVGAARVRLSAEFARGYGTGMAAQSFDALPVHYVRSRHQLQQASLQQVAATAGQHQQHQQHQHRLFQQQQQQQVPFPDEGSSAPSSPGAIPNASFGALAIGDGHSAGSAGSAEAGPAPRFSPALRPRLTHRSASSPSLHQTYHKFLPPPALSALPEPRLADDEWENASFGTAESTEDLFAIASSEFTSVPSSYLGGDVRQPTSVPWATSANPNLLDVRLAGQHILSPALSPGEASLDLPDDVMSQLSDAELDEILSFSDVPS
jgi:hypothetical protein